MLKLTHLLVGSAVCPNDGRGARHVDAALVVIEVDIADVGLVFVDEPIEEPVCVFLLTSQLAQTALVGRRSRLACRGSAHELAWQQRCVLRRLGRFPRSKRRCWSPAHAAEALERKSLVGTGRGRREDGQRGDARVCVRQGQTLLLSAGLADCG